VDEYADLLRCAAANAGNDHRLGAHEAPPAIISIFLGEQLTDILEQIENNGGAKSLKQAAPLKIGVTTLPVLPKDATTETELLLLHLQETSLSSEWFLRQLQSPAQFLYLTP